MATYITDKIEFNNNVYKLQDSDALPLAGGNVTGPVNFGNTVTMEQVSVGDLVITGNASSTNNLQVNTINGILFNIIRNRGIQYIRGTWTAASGTWTGISQDMQLYDGKQIILYMPYAGSGNATLNLTLADGNTTGAKNVYFEGTTRFTTQKGQDSQLHLIYHEGIEMSNGTIYSGWWYL